MLFSRIASYFVGFVSVGLLATASALPAGENDEKKRQSNSVSNVLSSLNSKVNTILPKIGATDPNDVTSTTTVSPLLTELVSTLESATNSLTLLGGLGLEKRAAEAQDVANQLSTITTNIANTLAPFKNNRNFIIFGGLLGEIDLALKGLLFQVSFLVDGVLFLLSGLLVDVAIVLRGLAFTLTLTLLGLL